MLFWIICGLIVLVVCSYVVTPLLRPAVAQDENPDVALYRAQLAEVDRDVSRGVLDADDAERARTEIARRLISANRRGPDVQGSTGPGRGLAITCLAALLLISGATYLTIGSPGEPDQPLSQRIEAAQALREARPSQAALVATAPEPPVVDAPEEYLASVAELRRVMPDRPDDVRGWELLAFHEAELRNFAAAAEAQARLVALRGESPPEVDLQRLLDLMVIAAGGTVSPEAEALARDILEQNDQSLAARYYLGAMHDQTARPDIAFRIWRPLVESGADTYHTALARAQISGTALRAGVDYDPPEVRGPGLDDIAAAEELSEEDRAAMIGNMVAGLADRLATQGGPATDWARLIRAYGVLGDREAAEVIWLEAQQAFGADDGSMALLREAALAAGLIE